MSCDPFKRREVSPGVYQCGCRWERLPVFGDVLRECVFHEQVGAARLAKSEREHGKQVKPCPGFVAPGAGESGGEQ